MNYLKLEKFMVIGICDDEKSVVDILEEKVKKYIPNAKVVRFLNGESLLNGFASLDILLLDIQIPDINGMEVSRKIRRTNKNLQIIFVTGLEEYVFEAFDVAALHYLVKPIDEKKLACVLKMAQEKLDMIDKNNEKNFNIIVASNGIHIKIYLKDIIYAEVFNRKIVIHTINDDIEYYGKMSDLENMVGEDFFRPHRAYLINMKYVEKYDSNNIYLEKGQVLMAKKNYKNFVKHYMDYSIKEVKNVK